MKTSLLPLGFSILAGPVMFGGLLLLSGNEAHGRLQYSKAFDETYPDHKAAARLASKCSICHPAAAKTTRNDYGNSLATLIGAENEKDVTKIKDALKKVEGEPSGIAGKTFGDLLKDGKLPGK